MADFQVKIKDFEGPLELLLNLIEKRKMHINDVSLAQVADDYVEHIKTLTHPSGETPPGYAGQVANFILVASTLMLIKSHSLLPSLSLTQEETQSIEDLERRLKLYQRARELARHISERFGQTPMYPREPSKFIDPVFTPTKELTPPGLLASMRAIISSFPKLEKLPEAVVKKVISLEEVVENLTHRIQRAIKMRFSEFVTKEARGTVIISFLGMLELVKEGIIAVKQQSHFNDIEMESTKPDIPRY